MKTRSTESRRRADARSDQTKSPGAHESERSSTGSNQSIQRRLRGATRPHVDRVGVPGSHHESQAQQIARSIDIAPAPETRRLATKIDSARDAATFDRPARDAAANAQPSAVAGAGQPLPLTTREFLENRFDQDLSGVRVHDDSAAHESARQLRAKAFTVGSDIFFSQGRFAQETSAGLRLLAHEVTHTIQQRRGGIAIVQADFESDFAGRQEVPVEGTPVPPPGTVKVKTLQAEGGKWVYAPFGIYSPNEVPDKYQDRILDSSQAIRLRKLADESLPEAARREGERLANQNEVTVRDMRTYSDGAGKPLNVRILMVKVGSDYRFVGFDMSRMSGGVVHKGFVESEELAEPVGGARKPTTGGVGRALFADRCIRALQSGATEMSLQVYTSERTENFHAEIYAVVGRPGAPIEYEHYTLKTREMIRIALSWSQSLTAQQRLELSTLASAATEPTPAEATAAMTRRTEGEEPAVPGQISPEVIEAMRGLGRQVAGSVRKAIEVKDYSQLSDPDVADRAIKENGGYVTVGGRMYRLQYEGANVRAAELSPLAIRQTISAGTSAAPAPAPSAKSRNALDPHPYPAPTKQPASQGTPEVKEGDVMVVPYRTFIEARDAKTGEVFFGVFESARWYRLETAKGEGMRFDPLTGERLIKTGLRTAQGQPLYARTWDPEPYAPGGGGGGGRIAQGVVAVGGIIQVINELLGPIGAALQAQRAWIARGEAEFSFWTALGADPLKGVWDRQGEAPAPPGQKPDTAVLGHWFFPYIVDINPDRVRANLPLRTASYQELQNLLAIGKSLGAIKADEGKFTAFVNRWDRGKEHRYDITQAVTQTMTQVLQGTDERLKSELAAMSAADRAGKIFRINPGANLYRSEQGQQVIRNSAEHIGPNPWVRELNRRSSNALQYIWTGYRGTRVLVAPVNADAHRAAAFAQYVIYKPIDDVWKEVKVARPVSPAELPSEPLNSFSASPGKGEVVEFGFTSYIRDPYNPGQWTQATGELKAFWVNANDLTPMGDKEVDKFIQK